MQKGPGLPGRHLEQMQLPAGSSEESCGGAFTSLDLIRPAAYVGGLADTLETIVSYDHAATEAFDDSSTWDNGASTSLVSAKFHFDAIVAEPGFHVPVDIDKTACGDPFQPSSVTLCHAEIGSECIAIS